MNTMYLLIVIVGGGAMTFEVPDANTCLEMKKFAESEFAKNPNLPRSALGAACFEKLGGRGVGV